tara:strand:- start:607 stop:1575 length:969 start_codon:yes stop_codon:yes gene_type:complete
MSQHRVVFMGSPALAASVLKSLLHEKQVEIVACYTQPPKPAGRGKKLQKTEVHALAESFNIPVYTPSTLRNPEVQAQFESLQAQLVIVVAYGLLLPKEILAAPRLGCINIHASLLPHYRGAAPVQYALLRGEKHTGLSLMQLNEGMDSGPVFATEKLPLLPFDTTATVLDKMAKVAGSFLSLHLPKILNGTLKPQEQDHARATYAPKITKEQTALNFNKSAQNLVQEVQAYAPFPGSFCFFRGKRLKILQATAKSAETNEDVLLIKDKAPGTIVSHDFSIKCVPGFLCPLIVQQEGAKPMRIEAFLKGHQNFLGERLIFDSC